MKGDLDGRTILITGANTGIGRAAAQELARRGAHLVLACRSEAKTRPVIDAIRHDTGNDAVEFLGLDLTDLASVRTAARRFVAGGAPLHVLINNAGVAGQRGLTKDGFELAFGVNHLGHFLFTQLLLDRLRASAPARVVTVASAAHPQAKGIDFAALRRRTPSFTGLPEYAVSKLCNVLFTQELARRLEGTGVTTAAVHPGVIASDIWRRIPSPLREIYMRLARMKSTEDGARPLVFCATAPQVADSSGRYYHECRDGRPSRVATPELARRLWEQSVAWTAE
jgi:NAD(P)-dependent dehydrogenase (short-subunit alcohol dehydrogenase family)